MPIILNDKIQRVYNPVQWTLNLIPLGGTPKQMNDADNNLYYPDRSVTPMTVKPVFRIIDKDTKTVTDMTNRLTSISWTFRKNGGAAQPCTEAEGFPPCDPKDVAADPSLTNARVVRRNVGYGTVITLILNAEYVDTLRSRTMKVSAQMALTSRSVASLLLYSKLDKPSCVICDPFEIEKAPLCKITPFFQIGKDKVNDLSIIGGWWYYLDEAGKEQPVNVNSGLMYNSYDPKTFSLTIDKGWVSDVVLRFKSALFPDKKIPSVPPVSANANDVRLVRKYPDGITFERVLSADGAVSAGLNQCPARVVATGPDGVIEDPDKYWTVEWQLRDTSAGAEYKTVATGFGPVMLNITGKQAQDVQIIIKERDYQSKDVFVTLNGKLLVCGGKAVVMPR